MSFTSFEFLIFLPTVLAACAATPPRWRWATLFAGSLVFYGFSTPQNLVSLGTLILIAHSAATALSRPNTRMARRAIVVSGLTIILGSLAIFKFYDFFAGEIERFAGASLHLPRLGIVTPAGYSFIAFSAASYLIDSYRRAFPVAGLGHTALFLAFFPKILSGPIERATSFLPQLVNGILYNPSHVLVGLQLITLGLIKKVVIANNLAPLVDRTFAIVAFASPMELLISVYFFAFQIYCDFSGYTDIAIGVALLFGIVLTENFKRPYLSQGISEFWTERWHISLARWFRDYVFFPLGGSRSGLLRTCFNILFVFMISGLWHAGLGYGVGWTFLAWGALNGFYVCAAHLTRPLWHRVGAAAPRLPASLGVRIARGIFTFHLVLLSWVFFRAATIGDAMTVFRKIASAIPELPAMVPDYPFRSEHLIGIGLILGLLVFEALDERRPVLQRLAAAPLPLRWAAYYVAIFSAFLFGNWQIKQFVYMQF